MVRKLGHLVIMGDSRSLSNVESSSVKVCVTSPPYFRKKDYETQYSTYEQYLDYLQDVWLEVRRVLKESGLLFVNIGDSFDNQFKSHDVARAIVDLGFNLVQTVIWVKGHYTPVQGDRHMNHLFEYVFVFSKSGDYSLDRLGIGVPYKDKSNIGRWKVATKDVRCRGDVWHVNYETVQRHSQKLHDAIYPVELAKMCIRLANLKKSELVLDPFLGSGTTIVAADELGLNAIGYEINPQYAKIIRTKLAGVKNYKIIRQEN